MSVVIVIVVVVGFLCLFNGMDIMNEFANERHAELMKAIKEKEGKV